MVALTEVSAEGGTSAPWPFFHHGALTEVLGLSGKLIRVEGVRGGGRTVLVGEILERGTAAGERPQLIRGRNREESRNLLASVAAGTVSGDVIVDDCDRLLRSTRAGEPDGEIVSSLWNVKELIAETDYRLVMILNGDPSELLDYDRDLSDLIQSSEEVEMKPWKIDWPALLYQEVAKRYGDDFREVALKIFGHSLLLNEQLVRSWISTTMALTGCHPTLVGPAMSLLSRHIEAGSRSRSAEHDGKESDLAPAIEAHLARAALPYVRRRIKKLRESEFDIDSHASRVLMRIAENGGDLPASEVLLDIGAALERECLAYLDQREGVYRILGRMIVQEVMRPPATSATISEIVRVVPAPGDDNRGAVVVERGGTWREVAFDGSPWRVLQALEASRGKTVSIKQLEAMANRTEPAIRTALHRLSSGLRKHDLGDIIENVRGAGYRLVG